MRIALIGSGRVASCMGPRLKEAGHTIAGVYSRTLQNAQQLATVLGAPAIDSLEQLPDAEGREDTLFIHIAGSVSAQVWKDAGAGRYGVMYAMQTFSKGAVIDWPQVPVFVEGSSESEQETIKTLAHDLSGNVSVLSSNGRKKLHIAAVFACNFANHMYAISERLLESEGVPFSVMLPLVRETARKVEQMSPASAQTGPAVRGDRKVIDEHLRLLSENPEYAELYRLISIDINKELK